MYDQSAENPDEVLFPLKLKYLSVIFQFIKIIISAIAINTYVKVDMDIHNILNSSSCNALIIWCEVDIIYSLIVPNVKYQYLVRRRYSCVTVTHIIFGIFWYIIGGINMANTECGNHMLHYYFVTMFYINTLYTLLTLFICFELAKSHFTEGSSFNTIYNYIQNSYNLQMRKYADTDIYTSCSICLTEFIINEDIVCLQCDHIFHKSCIVSWADRQLKCPNCRLAIV
ncbi:MAG: hypothetical protein Faunusvirus1_66 [Faunusvirus sp.]|jgi:hypothetical protein|uniref:RING-type domain-containing protein n=1 Tax=Faunusvirus sp. TaxID=2487766 RepID=A0A3G4ZVY8_9VIRU|nr:MAG: hypothetical protein Faunusvirus1_66 [Faunusvirus sp.]